MHLNLVNEKYSVSNMFFKTYKLMCCSGSEQLAFAECNLKQMEKDNVKLIRRKSGGAIIRIK